MRGGSLSGYSEIDFIAKIKHFASCETRYSSRGIDTRTHEKFSAGCVSNSEGRVRVVRNCRDYENCSTKSQSSVDEHIELMISKIVVTWTNTAIHNG